MAHQSQLLPRVVRRHEYVLQVLEHLMHHQEKRAHVVVCSSRSSFLDELATCFALSEYQEDVRLAAQREIPSSQDPDEQHLELSVRDRKPHFLLMPTLQTIAASENVELAFCPTLPVFRAHFSSLPHSRQPSDRSRSRRLIILNLLYLHHGTTQFTLQGLSRTFALVASVSHGAGYETELVECRDPQDPQNPQRGPQAWHGELPLLNDSIKISEAGSRWASRTTEIRKLAKRWFYFDVEKGGLEPHEA